MCDDYDNYQSGDNEGEHFTPKIPLTSLNDSAMTQLRNMLRELPHDEKVEYLEQCSDFENRLNRKLQDWAEKQNISYLAQRMQSQHPTSSCNLLDWIDFLIEAASCAESLYRVDESAMKELAFTDPGAYAQALICRRNSDQCKHVANTGTFTRNELKEYVSSQMGVPFPGDHKAWYIYIEENATEFPQLWANQLERISPFLPLSALSEKSTITKQLKYLINKNSVDD
ncbi:hypothetical protein K6Y31_04705 [Motilimonas cestriensis]|uniref:Uncharacterized protein n=1 Tax=Motilimonas cestriensis TaxID=2742685 RepID=A0ABS8W9P4_9GAMM|nr:hypothetical protein [Motilimonas cestriensis]MCE2594110.1 hypothetical protein [Motilimonas cestriensis]